MATFTVHQWPDLKAGLTQMRRVTRNTLVILTCDLMSWTDFGWMTMHRKSFRSKCVAGSRRPSNGRLPLYLGMELAMFI